MSISPTALSSALNALKLYNRRVDQAAEAIAAAGLTDGSADSADGTGAPAGPPSATSAGVVDLPDAMTSMLIAQRAFVAQLRVLRTADEMLRETVESVRR